MNPLLRTSRNPTEEKKAFQINSQRSTNRLYSPFLMIGEKMDRKLTKAYQSLRQQQAKPQNLCRKTVFNHPQTQRTSCKNDGFITIRLKRQKMRSSINNYESPPQPIQKSIVLIDNSDVMEYIHQVYQNYGIKDPLGINRNSSNQNRFQTTQTKRIKQIDLSTQAHSLKSARTNKDSTDSIVHISQFNIEQSQVMKPSPLKRQKKILITLRPKTHSKGKHYSNGKLLQSKIDIKQSSAPTIKCKEKDQSEQLPRIRYCFACERQIIQQKISRHQQTCLLLKLAYTYSYQKIFNILNEKITRLTSQVQRQIVDIDSKQIFKHFQGLKQKTEQMMIEINKKRVLENKQSRNIQEIDSWKGKFKQAKMNIDANFSNKFSLLSKLGWFASLRENLSQHVQLKMT